MKIDSTKCGVSLNFVVLRRGEETHSLPWFLWPLSDFSEGGSFFADYFFENFSFFCLIYKIFDKAL
ncbi:MAG: hypothetical protein SPI34_01690 [Opitutales bacterium]|nr:hypothetical protein [Opitutales bacterium]